MNEPTLICKDEQRRHEIRKRCLNGLDYLEVSQDQLSLYVYFVGNLPKNITKQNILIEGGQRIRDIQVVNIELEIQEDSSLDSYLRVFLDKFGDFSTYTLRLVGLQGIDARYAYLNFSFKVDCPSDLDCKSQLICPEEELIEPEINYLAKDYSSFRQLILDRLALIMPNWQERHAPDLLITLVELLAYVGDYLSYYQDAVATEAYLDTARQRISVRRHARLVDYLMHEGCNARTWIWLETNDDTSIKLEDIYFITKYQQNSAADKILTADDLKNIPTYNYEVFEPIFTQSQAPFQIYQAHNEIQFYTWGNHQCCLPKGATSATLLDAWTPSSSKQVPTQEESCGDDKPKPLPPLERKLKLKPGDFLIFIEEKGAKTGNVADADITHRHVVRLTSVKQSIDAVYTQTIKVDNTTQEKPTPIVEITWAVEDALPFPLCISAIGFAPECELIENISIARGNVILADHGRTLAPEDLLIVKSKQNIAICEAEGQPADIVTVAEKFYPRLKYTPLTFRQPLSIQELLQAPASKLLTQNPRLALPQVTSLPKNTNHAWTPQPDLLASRNQDRHFVVELDNEGYAHLRFGNGVGQQPEVCAHFFATYRIGNGIAGNIGADTITHAVFRREPKSIIPHNPLPALGGTQPEPISEVKLFAPQAFRQELQRAITADDYANIVMRDFGAVVQRAAATLRWTGSWYEVLVVIDPLGSEVKSELKSEKKNKQLLEAITKHLYRFRRIGHDVVVRQAVYVPLDIAMTICVQPNYLRGHVKAELLNVFSNRMLVNGRRGFFHPDNLTFGTGIALSKLVATAQAILGVENVVVTKLQRLNEGDNGELNSGILSLDSLEIAQLDNDPNFPENGKLKLDMRGGR